MSMIMANYFRVGDGTAGDGGDTQNRRRPWPRKEPATGDRRRRVDIPAVFARPGLRVHGDITGHLGNKKTAQLLKRAGQFGEETSTCRPPRRTARRHCGSLSTAAPVDRPRSLLVRDEFGIAVEKVPATRRQEQLGCRCRRSGLRLTSHCPTNARRPATRRAGRFMPPPRAGASWLA
jgi:hypothetical protein